MIHIDNVAKTFPGKEENIHAVKDVSLHIGEGEIFGIVGYSGAGKSTLVRCINFLEIPDAGTIRVKGFGSYRADNKKVWYTPEGGDKETQAKAKDLQDLRRDMGMIFQHFNLLDRSTIFDNVAYSLKHKGLDKETIKKRVIELLDLVNLTDKISAYPSELSGGQKQRVAIARALASNPKILLSDEATSALDPDATESILNLLKDLNKRLGLTIVLITHEMAVVKAICDKVAVMEDGKVVEEGRVYDVFSKPKQEVTRKFVSSTTGLANVDKLLSVENSGVRPDENSVLVQCIYDKDCVGEAVISEASRKYDVSISIVLANVEMIQDNPLGHLVVIISGTDEKIDNALNFIRECRVDVEVIEDGRMARIHHA
ncbi:MAG: ATP-binding cassette domain-containing protein [Lachnospiraceae bacterium]|nr:ATP-binding cassette domain-containing protein [Lachnospiraceae bacterium]